MKPIKTRVVLPDRQMKAELIKMMAQWEAISKNLHSVARRQRRAKHHMLATGNVQLSEAIRFCQKDLKKLLKLLK